LAPPALSRRLQKMLRIKPFFPGIDVPPGLILPPGAVVPPGVVPPDFWSPGDPLPAGVWCPSGAWEFPPDWTTAQRPPPGVEIDPGTVWPDGWKVGDPLPAGVTLPDGFYYPPFIVPDNTLPDGTIVPPGTVFPADWTYGDPLPDGVTLPPGFAYDPAWSPDVSLPYNFTVDPGTVFPDDWTYGDPLPDGASAPPGTIYGRPSAFACPSNLDFIPPGRPSIAGSISPPSGSWLTAFDDTYWKPDLFPPGEYSYYDGAAVPPFWSSYLPDRALHILPNGTWHVGFRPSRIRITNNLPMYDTMWYIYDTGSNEVAQYTGQTNPFTLDCDFSANLDLKNIWANIAGHDISVRIWNIEFFD